MDREVMIEAIVNDLQDWCKRDRQSFWSHVEEMERDYLKDKSDKELKEIFEESKS